MRPHPNPWLIVALLAVVGALNYLDRTMISTMRVSILAAIPMTETKFGLLTSAFLWIYGLLSPLAGYLADRYSRSRVIVGSLLVWSLVTWLTSYCRSFEALLATRVLMGVSEACYIPAALALISDYHTGRTRSLATGIHIAGIYVGGSLGFLGGWVAEKHDWTYPFHIFGLVGVLYAAVLMLFLRDVRLPAKAGRQRVGFFNGVKDLFARPAYLRMLAFWGMMGIVGWMVMGWLPTYYRERFGLSQGIAGLYATGYLYPASIGGLLFGGWVSDKWNKVNPRARVLVPVIGLCLAAPCIFLASYTGNLPLAIGFFVIYAFTYVFPDANLMPVLCMVADERYRATGYGILNLFATIIGGLGIYAGGYLRDRHVPLGLIYSCAAVVLVICALLLYTIRWKDKNEIT